MCSNDSGNVMLAKESGAPIKGTLPECGVTDSPSVMFTREVHPSKAASPM